MRNLASLVGILCIIPIISSNSMTEITVKQGGSFVHYIDIDGGELKSCVVEVKKEKISLFPNHIKNAVIRVKSKLSSLGVGACGFRLNNFDEYDPSQYNLTATILKAGKKISSNQILKVNFRAAPVISNITESIEYGNRYYIDKCRPPSKNEMCSLYSPKGELVAEGANCGYVVSYVTTEHVNGAWKCEIHLSEEIGSIAFYINLKPKKAPTLVSWYKKQNGYGIIGCKYVNGEDDKNIVKSCKMFTPEKKLLSIGMHSAAGKYDSFGTNFTKNTCQLRFKLPAGKNETGTWMCELGQSDWLHKRGFINVEQASSYPKSLKLLTKIGDSPRINCDVPYPASNSFVVHPDGNVFYKASYADSQDGRLSFSVDSIKESDFGQWACHFGKNNSYDDDVVTVDVERFDLVKPKLTQVDVDEGDELVMLFTANSAISYCTIEDPKSNTYHIRPNTKSPYLEYYGAGFEHGECGIKLKHASALHEGIWKCMTTTVISKGGDGKKQTFARTMVDVKNEHEAALASASSWSILAGVVFAVMVALAFVIYGKLRKPVKQHVSPANSIGDEDSETCFVLHRL